MKYIICSCCEKRKQVRHNRYKQLVKIFSSKENLKQNYICQKCKIDKAYRLIKNKTKSVKIAKISNIDDFLDSSASVLELKNKIQQHVNWINEKGVNDSFSRNIFYKNIKFIFEQENIRDFIINVLENKVVSITINKIPLIRSYIIKIL